MTNGGQEQIFPDAASANTPQDVSHDLSPDFDNIASYDPLFLDEIGDAEIIAELLELYLRDTSERIEALKVALRDGNCTEEVFRIAHKIKGGSGSLGFRRMERIAEALENPRGALSSASFQSLLQLMEREFAHIKQFAPAIIRAGDDTK